MRRCVLALFAHPDDEAYGAAGTLGACARRGTRATSLNGVAKLILIYTQNHFDFSKL